jgi:hypothetical protein
VGKITLSVVPSGTITLTKYAAVMTNDELLGQFQLRLKFTPFVPTGYRIGAFLLDPGNEIEATLAPGQSYEGKVEIFVRSEKAIAIKKTVADNLKFTIKLEPIEAGKRYHLLVKSADKLPAGTHKLLVKLLTDDPNQEVVEVTVTVRVEAEASK